MGGELIDYIYIQTIDKAIEKLFDNHMMHLTLIDNTIGRVLDELYAIIAKHIAIKFNYQTIENMGTSTLIVATAEYGYIKN